MNLKIFGAIFVVVGCGGWGFMVAAQHMQKIRLLRNLSGAIAYMECELQYRSTVLPVLCEITAKQSTGKIRQLLLAMGTELEAQVSPNAEQCMEHAMEKCGEIPKPVHQLCAELGQSLGKFDLQGQLRGLESVRSECECLLTQLQYNQDVRLRSYQTLGLCAGAAMAILFI